MRPLALAALLIVAATASSTASADTLHGHSGPVNALAADAARLISGGFDSRALLWDLTDAGRVARVERAHDGTVTAVALTAQGFVTAGQDGRVALWQDDQQAPLWITPPGTSPVSALAVQGDQIAAGFFDGRIAFLDARTGDAQTVQAHEDRLSGLAWLADGTLAAVSADRRFSRWQDAARPLARAGLPELPNAMARAGDKLAVVFAEGTLRLLSPEGEILPERFLTDRPLIAVAARPDLVAAAAIDGTLWLLDMPDLSHRAQIAAAQGPIWALALTEQAVLAATAQGAITRFSATDGAPIGTQVPQALASLDDGSRGYQVWQACAVCHALTPDDHSRAGPSLHNIFGRPIASVAGYDFSPALRDMDIVWTAETVAALFEYGPDAYTPGSRMPDQRVSDPADRQALVEFLARFSD
ncbi:MAG: c-type cytochrome [Roseinatronobacter sp.]